MALSLPSPGAGKRAKKDQVSHGDLVFRRSGYWALLGLVAAATARSAIAGSATVAAASCCAVAIGAVHGPGRHGAGTAPGCLCRIGRKPAYIWRSPPTAVASIAATTAVAGAAFARGLACCAAVGAAAGGAKTLRLVEFLFTFGERKLLSAFNAGEVLVRHVSLANSY
jgi:hypothetical protein